MTTRNLLATAAVAVAIVTSPAAATETVVAPFTTPDAAVTTGLYSGIVRVRVSGIGQSSGTTYNDAFHVFNSTIGFNSAQYYQLAFDTIPLVGFNPSREAKYFIVGGIPAYSTTHSYDFLLNTGLAIPGALHFGVSDGGYSDNTGRFVITVGVPEPASWALMIAGFGMVGVAMRRRKAVVAA
jgi:hypothetical protein